MKLSIQKNALVTAINQVSKAVASNSSIPVLNGIRLVATEKGIELTGSDTNTSIISFIPVEFNGDTLAEIEKDGSIVLQAKYLSDIVKKLPKDDVQIEVEGYVANIKSGKSTFKLNGLDSEEYPRLPVIDDKNVITLSSSELKALITQTVYAVSTSETRPVLTGVQWQVKQSVLICTATDSHRLSRREKAIKGLDTDITVVIPGSSLQELNKVLDDSDEEVDVILTETQVIFCCGHLTFYSRLLEGNYPDTSRLIPAEVKTKLAMNVKELSDSLGRVSLLGSSQNKIARMDIQKESMFIELSAKEQEIGKVNEELLSEALEGDDLTISFNAKYMQDALKTMKGTVELQFNGAMRPFVLREKGNNELLQLLLPVRTY
ncbi:DNA polymerase III subunit beta [Bacillaceae bacterium CLA-AA-H227]|uniref:DNA polymerase III subunit beta n=1 Tax=Robertmurraya yapensis (ex Hitch et al 2024) TaxID=3133160 RepID=A0ACC6SGQ1_9BACI